MDEDIKARLIGLDPPVNVLLDTQDQKPYLYRPGGFSGFLAARQSFVQIHSPQVTGTDAVLDVGLVQLDVIGLDKALAVTTANRVRSALHQHPAESTFGAPYQLLTEASTPLDTGYKITLTFMGQTRSHA